jgi:hypothetical protein
VVVETLSDVVDVVVVNWDEMGVDRVCKLGSDFSQLQKLASFPNVPGHVATLSPQHRKAALRSPLIP